MLANLFRAILVVIGVVCGQAAAQDVKAVAPAAIDTTAGAATDRAIERRLRGIFDEVEDRIQEVRDVQRRIAPAVDRLVDRGWQLVAWLPLLAVAYVPGDRSTRSSYVWRSSPSPEKPVTRSPATFDNRATPSGVTPPKPGREST